jgi:hypothetical protein
MPGHVAGAGPRRAVLARARANAYARRPRSSGGNGKMRAERWPASARACATSHASASSFSVPSSTRIVTGPTLRWMCPQVQRSIAQPFLRASSSLRQTGSSRIAHLVLILKPILILMSSRSHAVVERVVALRVSIHYGRPRGRHRWPAGPGRPDRPGHGHGCHRCGRPPISSYRAGRPRRKLHQADLNTEQVGGPFLVTEAVPFP